MASPTVLPGQVQTAALLGIPAWTGITLLNSWTNGGGTEVNAQYRLWQLNNSAEIIGNIVHASISGTSQIATLPYTPSSTLRIGLDAWSATNAFATATVTPILQLTTAGVLNAVNLPSGTTNITFHAWFPLDA